MASVIIFHHENVPFAPAGLTIKSVGGDYLFSRPVMRLAAFVTRPLQRYC